MKNFKENLPKYMFMFSIVFMAFIYGYICKELNLFPSKQIQSANAFRVSLMQQFAGEKQWYYQPTEEKLNVPIYNKDMAFNGSTIFSCVGEDNYLFVKIVDMDGSLIHQWKIDWFEIWPDCEHVPESDKPKSRPGTQIQGITLLDNGDLVFNFSGLGLVRMDPCGKVVWRLAHRTHHSIHQDEQGNLWVPRDIFHQSKVADYPFLKPIFLEPTILKISPEGKVLKEISMLDVLVRNNYNSLLVMSTKARTDVRTSGDILHLNDVETFPDSLKEGFFTKGDILVSLRNINTVLVFNEADLKIKYIKIGDLVRQHDADFIDGNTISVYDNNNIAQKDKFMYSNITILDAVTNQTRIYYKGTPEAPFFSNLMGRHQWLPNGNMLITESSTGRAFEINDTGKIVWEYINIVEKGYVGIMEEAIRISPVFNRDFFKKKIAECAD